MVWGSTRIGSSANVSSRALFPSARQRVSAFQTGNRGPGRSMVLAPPQPRGQHACLHLDGHRFTTGGVPYGTAIIDPGIDIFDSTLWIRVSDGRATTIYPSPGQSLLRPPRRPRRRAKPSRSATSFLSGGAAASPVAPGQQVRVLADRAGDGRAGPAQARPQTPRWHSSKTTSRRARNSGRPNGGDPPRDGSRAATGMNRNSRRGHTSRSAGGGTTSRPTPGIPRSRARWAPSPGRSPRASTSIVP